MIEKGLYMRLDKFLCEMGTGTRSQVRTYVRQGLVTVNGRAVKSADTQIEEDSDRIAFRGKVLQYRRYVYYMMNKPKGVVSATQDNTAPAVVSLLGSGRRDDIFPVGRLDKDTTGLLLLTNDGELAHRLLSPGRHVDKVYKVSLEHPLSEADIRLLEQGVAIGDEKRCMPACVEVIGDTEILLTIREGRFHQVKRMLQAVGNGVLELERAAFGGLELDGGLQPGEYRELTDQETALLRKTAFPDGAGDQIEVCREVHGDAGAGGEG